MKLKRIVYIYWSDLFYIPDPELQPPEVSNPYPKYLWRMMEPLTNKSIYDAYAICTKKRMQKYRMWRLSLGYVHLAATRLDVSLERVPVTEVSYQ